MARAYKVGTKRRASPPLAVIGSLLAHALDVLEEDLEGLLHISEMADGKVATDGWSKLTGHEVVDLAKKFQDYGVEGVIYTDIGRDGMLSGPNIEATRALAESLTIPVIASGGVSEMKDIRALAELERFGVTGVITGKAIYSGSLDLKAAIVYSKTKLLR